MSVERPARSTLRWLPGAAIAVFTGCYQVLLASDPTNDHFMNIVWGREIVASHDGRIKLSDRTPPPGLVVETVLPACRGLTPE